MGFIDHISIEDTAYLLEATYTRAILAKGWGSSLSKYISKNARNFPNNSDSVPCLEDVRVIKSGNKMQVANVIAKALHNDDFVNLIMNKLPSKFYNEWIWDNIGILDTEITAETGIEICVNRGWNYELRGVFNIFLPSGENFYGRSSPRYLRLPYFIAERFKDFVETPPLFEWVEIATISSELSQFSFESEAQSCLLRLFTYIQNGILKRGKNGSILLGGLSKAKVNMDFANFFPNSKSKNAQKFGMRLMTDIADYLFEYQEKGLNNQNILQYILKHIISGDFDLFDHLKWYLKNVKNVYKNDHSEQKYFIDAIKNSAIATKNWVSSDNFFHWMKYHSMVCMPYDGIEYSSLSPAISIENSRFNESFEINNDNYHDLVLRPYYYGVLYLLSAIGLVDIACNPSDEHVVLKSYSSLESVVFIPYNSVKFFKVNELGRFVLGLTKEYKSKSNSSFEPLTFTLETDYPGIQFSRPDQALSGLLKEYAQNISPTMMVVNRTTFLNKIKTKKDLKDKIRSFSKIVNQDFPPNWKKFFESLETGFNPLKKEIGDFYIYKIPETNQEIVDLLTYDVSIRDLVIRAEGHRILVKKEDHAKFVSRMKDKGWVI